MTTSIRYKAITIGFWCLYDVISMSYYYYWVTTDSVTERLSEFVIIDLVTK